MKRSWQVVLAFIVVAIIAGAAYAWGNVRGSADLSGRLAEKVAENARLTTLQEQTASRADSLEQLFDSLSTASTVSAARADSSIQRWRRRYLALQDQSGTPPGTEPSPPDAAEMSELLVAADSTITVCEDALGDCTETVAEARGMQVAERRARFAAAERAATMETNWNEAQARVDRILRWRPYREAAIGTGGLLVGLAACFVAR